MGVDDMSVVDPLTMRVHGVDGLRVVDASSMPYVTNGNIYAPVMMLAEKAADLILGNTPLPPRPSPSSALVQGRAAVPGLPATETVADGPSDGRRSVVADPGDPMLRRAPRAPQAPVAVPRSGKIPRAVTFCYRLEGPPHERCGSNRRRDRPRDPDRRRPRQPDARRSLRRSRRRDRRGHQHPARPRVGAPTACSTTRSSKACASSASTSATASSSCPRCCSPPTR